MQKVKNKSQNSICEKFSKSSKTYDNFSSVQRDVVDDNLEFFFRLKDQKIIDFTTSQSAVDLGCGTGYLLEKLSKLSNFRSFIGYDISDLMLEICERKLSKKQNIKFVQGDFDEFSLGTSEIEGNIIFSTSALQWVGDLNKFARSLLDLNPQTISVSVMLDSSLSELRNLRSSLFPFSSHREDLPTTNQIIDAFSLSGYEVLLSETKNYKVSYASCKSMLQAIKQVGSYGKKKNNIRDLTYKELLKLIMTYDKKYKINGKVSASYDVLHMILDRR